MTNILLVEIDEILINIEKVTLYHFVIRYTKCFFLNDVGSESQTALFLKKAFELALCDDIANDDYHNHLFITKTFCIFFATE